jgi:1-acyl-sn-glycerol-3-phosphate acyltransferase
MRPVVRFFWNLFGWKIVGDMPADLKKYIIITAPHTSNWDFLIGLCVRSILGFESNFLGKKSLFRWPHGWLFRKLGGYPVDRTNRNNLVDQVVELFQSQQKFVLALAPEGTRKTVSDWKTGFYYISLKAKVPIVRSKFDIKNKCVTIFPPYWPTGNIQVDMVQIKEVFKL